jgi:hypothetical protein
MRNHRGIFAFIMFILTTSNFWCISTGQILDARKAGVKLPSALSLASAVFDGEDSVYIIGGYTFHLHIYRVNPSIIANCFLNFSVPTQIMLKLYLILVKN